jgi:uncharacterized membrane protein YsdA (DUF1294 family)
VFYAILSAYLKFIFLELQNIFETRGWRVAEAMKLVNSCAEGYVGVYHSAEFCEH